MFEYLGTILVDIDPGFDVLRYLTVRTIGGTITALLLTIFLGPKLISWLQRMQFKQYGVERGPDSHKQKSGTPTMGGLLIISSLLMICLPDSSSISITAFRTPLVTSSNGASTVVGASPLYVNRYSLSLYSIRIAFVVVLPQSVAKIVFKAILEMH